VELPQVLDACVVSLPDDRLGEVPAALVVTADDGPDEDQVLEALRERLAPYMLPAVVLLRGEMPLNSMMKKDRRLITSMLASELEARKQRA
jgi:long-chain acyl-CoA synthetase